MSNTENVDLRPKDFYTIDIMGKIILIQSKYDNYIHDEDKKDENYGIACNLIAVDRCLRMGYLAIVVGKSGAMERFRFWGMGRGGRRIIKWCHIKRFSNFRVKWFPDNIIREVQDRGTKEDMIKVAKEYQELSDYYRDSDTNKKESD